MRLVAIGYWMPRMPADAPAGRYLIAGAGGNERHRSLALVADLAEMRPHARRLKLTIAANWLTTLSIDNYYS